MFPSELKATVHSTCLSLCCHQASSSADMSSPNDKCHLHTWSPLRPENLNIGGVGAEVVCVLWKSTFSISAVCGFCFSFSYNIYFYNSKNRLEKVRFIDRDLVLTMTDFYSLIKSLPCFSLNRRVEPWTVNPTRAGTCVCFMLFGQMTIM